MVNTCTRRGVRFSDACCEAACAITRHVGILMHGQAVCVCNVVLTGCVFRARCCQGMVCGHQPWETMRSTRLFSVKRPQKKPTGITYVRMQQRGLSCLQLLLRISRRAACCVGCGGAGGVCAPRALFLLRMSLTDVSNSDYHVRRARMHLQRVCGSVCGNVCGVPVCDCVCGVCWWCLRLWAFQCSC